MVAAAGWETVRTENAEAVARLAVDETGRCGKGGVKGSLELPELPHLIQYIHPIGAFRIWAAAQGVCDAFSQEDAG